MKVESVDRENRRLSLSLAGPARAEEEEGAELAAFRRQATEDQGKSMGSLGDLMKAKQQKRKK